MSKYQIRPLEPETIEAFQFDGTKKCLDDLSNKLSPLLENRRLSYKGDMVYDWCITIGNISLLEKVYEGDYIIRHQGYLEVVSKSEFEKGLCES